MVSFDANNNRLPDDPWYELAGSEYRHPATIRDYRIVYQRPDPDKLPTPDANYPALNDTTYIPWTTNGYGSGYIFRNIYHDQSYYPLWLPDDQLTFTGAKLADNYIDESQNGSYYVQYAYPWGYVDNHPNTDHRSNFDIEWAVDSDGHPVTLPGIHFVKVYTAVNQYCGWLGETSTEIMGAYDLHFVPGDHTWNIPSHPTFPAVALLQNSIANTLIITASAPQTALIYNLSGARLMTIHLQTGINPVPCSQLPDGLYLLHTAHSNHKFLKRATSER
jgi:hypothetical protein